MSASEFDARDPLICYTKVSDGPNQFLNGNGKANTTGSNAENDVYKVRTDLGAKPTLAVASTGSSCVGVVVPTTTIPGYSNTI